MQTATPITDFDAVLVDLREALEQAQIHVEALLATGLSRTYSPRSGVMNQLADALRAAKFRADGVGASAPDQASPASL